MPRMYSLAQAGLRPKYAMYDVPPRFSIDEAAVEVEMRTKIPAQNVKKYILERLSEYMLMEDDARRLFTRLGARDPKVAIWVFADMIDQLADARGVVEVRGRTNMLKGYARGLLDKDALRKLECPERHYNAETRDRMLCLAAYDLTRSILTNDRDPWLAIASLYAGKYRDKELVRRAADAIKRLPYIE